MSVNLIQILPQGIIFAADRNVSDREPVSGVVQGQNESSKIALVDNRFLVSYVGAARLGGIDSLEYLVDLIESHRVGKGLDQIAKAINEEVQQQRIIDDENREDGPREQIISFAGFKQREGTMVPEVYYISNCWTLEKGEYKQVTGEFGCSDEVRIKSQEAKIPASMLRECLRSMAERNNPFGFQHSVGLEDFVIVDRFIKTSMDVLAKRNHFVHPESLDQWTSQARMSVLVYSAFFQRFYPLNQQLVGGGVDVLTLPWDA